MELILMVQAELPAHGQNRFHRPIEHRGRNGCPGGESFNSVLEVFECATFELDCCYSSRGTWNKDNSDSRYCGRFLQTFLDPRRQIMDVAEPFRRELERI